MGNTNKDEAYNVIRDHLSKEMFPEDKTKASFQHKGTDICMDVQCECGELGHVDGYFVYIYQCPQCMNKYIINHSIKLMPVADYLVRNSGFIPVVGS